MRVDATFIGIEVTDEAASDEALAAKLTEVCPVDIYAQAQEGALRILEQNVDECILCAMCIKARPDAVKVHKLYSGELLDTPA